VSDSELRRLIDKIVQTRADSNRRYIDQVLEKVFDQHRQFYLERLGYELRELELAQQNRNYQMVLRHRVMADIYKSIVEKCFPL